MKVVIAGVSGFVGAGLGEVLRAAGSEVTVLSRTAGGGRRVVWDGVTDGDWGEVVREADVLVNLAGQSIDGAATARYRGLILGSRLDAVGAIGRALAAAPGKRLWIQASAVGFYGDRGDEVCDESTGPGRGFLAETCAKVEQAATEAAERTGAECAVVRLGVVFGRDGGALQRLLRITRCGFGGAAGSGRQYVSWVHQEDATAALTMIAQRSLAGIFNITSPGPVRNRELMASLRRVCARPWCPPAPGFAVRLAARWILRTNADLALEGCRAVPERLRESGYRFRWPTLDLALEDLLERRV